MRLWSISPKYLDTKGLLALWREALLAKKVLEGKTKGYKNHPQLIRFKNTKKPLKFINQYLYFIFLEAKKRKYNFDETKFKNYNIKEKIPVTRGQIIFEFNHLLKKLKNRDKMRYEKLKKISPYQIEPNNIFRIIEGEKELWEKG